MEISNLEKQVLKIFYKEYLETKKIKKWELPDSFKILGIKEGMSISVITSSKYIKKGINGGHETWSLSDDGIRFMDSNIKDPKIWKTNKIKDEKYWAKAQRDENNVHIFLGKKGSTDKVHLINDLNTGEMRIDKSDQDPAEIIEEITTNVKLKDADGKSIKVVRGKISFVEDSSKTTFNLGIDLLKINTTNEINDVDKEIKDLKLEIGASDIEGKIQMSMLLSSYNPSFFQPTKEQLQKHLEELNKYKEYLFKISELYLFLCGISSSKYDEKVDIDLSIENGSLININDFKTLSKPQRPKSIIQNILNSSLDTKLNIHGYPYVAKDGLKPVYRSNIYLKGKEFGSHLEYVKPDTYPLVIPNKSFINIKSFPVVIKGIVNSQNSGGNYNINFELNENKVKEIDFKDTELSK